MKKLISLILAALFLLSFAACSGRKQDAGTNMPTSVPNGSESDAQEDTYVFDPETDFDNRFAKIFGYPFVKIPEGYVYDFDNGGSQIMYWVKETGESGILCGKPECDHNNTACPATIWTQGKEYLKIIETSSFPTFIY